MSYLGGIEDVGLSPYEPTGNPVIALIAQLNRFAGKTIKPPGKCGERHYVRDPFPLVAVLSGQAATAANIIMYDRYDCIVDASLINFKKLKWVMDGGASGDWSWAMNNLKEITVSIAQYGDSVGLAPASVGITTVDPKMAPKFPIMTVAIVGALAVGALIVSRRK